jgi:hypothetical protein
MTSWFRDQDDSYLTWVADHPQGYVLNCDLEPSAAYLVLHRASCRTVSGTPANGSSWTSTSSKACAMTKVDLDKWAQQRTGGTPAPCGLCHP